MKNIRLFSAILFAPLTPVSIVGVILYILSNPNSIKLFPTMEVLTIISYSTELIVAIPLLLILKIKHKLSVHTAIYLSPFIGLSSIIFVTISSASILGHFPALEYTIYSAFLFAFMGFISAIVFITISGKEFFSNQ